jgi:hypothetical protein
MDIFHGHLRNPISHFYFDGHMTYYDYIPSRESVIPLHYCDVMEFHVIFHGHIPWNITYECCLGETKLRVMVEPW